MLLMSVLRITCKTVLDKLSRALHYCKIAERGIPSVTVTTRNQLLEIRWTGFSMRIIRTAVLVSH